MLRTIFVLVIFTFIIFNPLSFAHAYIDPGTGSYFIQIIFASLVGASLVFKDTLFQVKNKLTQIMFKSKSSNEEKSDK